MWMLFIFASLCAAYVEGETYYAQTGNGITIKCGDANNRVEFWKHNDILIVNVDSKSGKTRTGAAEVAKRARPQEGTLRLENLQSRDRGKYTCGTIDRSKTKTTTNHQLEIVEVSVSVKPASPLLLDSSAKLECVVEGIPNPEIRWNPERSVKGNPISLPKVKPSDGGKWTCVAKAQGMTFEASLDVLVLGLSGPTEPVNVKQGSSASLTCTLSTSLGSLRLVEGGWRRIPPAGAGPHLPSLSQNETLGLHWNNIGTDESEVQFPKGSLGRDLTITLLKVKKEQAGQYECYVEFAEGRGTLKAVVTLDVTGGGGSAAGSGSAPKSGGTAGSSHSNPGIATRSWLGVNMWIWLGVGAGSLVLIVLLVAVVLISQSNRREKMRLRKLRSVRKPLTANDYCQCNRQPGGGDMNRAARGGLQRPHVPENIRINGGHGGRPHV